MYVRTALFISLSLIVFSLAQAMDAALIVGVWRTVDASDEEGKQQGGIVFRRNGSGEFLSPTLHPDEANREDLMKLLESATKGSTNLRFVYTMDDDLVTITVTHFGDVPVKESNAVRWKAELSGRTLKLTAQFGKGHWIVLRKI